MRLVTLFILLFSLEIGRAALEKAEIKLAFDPSPRLAITQKDLAQLKESPNFVARRDAAMKAADPLLAQPPILPNGFGSWAFYYANPRTGGPLVPLSLTEHKDPATGEVFRDERIVAAYRGKLHNQLDHAALKLGWAYVLTDDNRYAEGVRRILLKLAKDYPDYPKRQDRWGRKGWFAPLGGRRYVQSLDEAVGVIELAKAYDLTRQSNVYSKEDHQAIEERFFRPTADTLLWFNQGMSNHQTWYNAGLMSIASILSDAELVKTVLTMRGGFYDQLERSIGSDGLWYEGSMSYHRYALQAMIEIVDAARKLHIPLQDESKFKSLFIGPLHAAYPNGVFPAINDSDATGIQSFDKAWTWAWETYKDPLFARLLAKDNKEKLQGLLGPDAVLEWPLPLKSEVLKDAGLAVLRSGSGEGSHCVFIDFGPHGGGHGHFDKLNLTLYTKGHEWLLDPGRLTYSYKEYQTWVKTTAAHNTVVLNEANQRATTGKVLFFQEESDYSALGVESDAAYPHSLLRRFVFLNQNILVDVFDVKTRSGSQIDLFAHATADSLQAQSPKNLVSQDIIPGTQNGYQHLSKGLLWDVRRNSIWDYQWKNETLRVFLVGDPEEELITCRGIGFSIKQETPTLLRRRRGGSTRFIAVYDLTKDSSFVTSVSQNGEEIKIATVEGYKVLSFSESGVAVRNFNEIAPNKTDQ